MTNVQAFTARINAAQTVAEVERLSLALDRLFNNGFFTPAQLIRLDQKLCEKYEAGRREKAGG